MFNKSSHRSLHPWFHGEPLIFEGSECAFPPNCTCFCFERQWLVFIFLPLHMSTTLPSINYFPRPKFQFTEMFFNGSHLCSSSSLLTFSKLLLVLIYLQRLQKYTQHLEATRTYTLIMTFSKFILYIFTLIFGLCFSDQWVHDLTGLPITIPKFYSSVVILSSNS